MKMKRTLWPGLNIDMVEHVEMQECEDMEKLVHLVEKGEKQF